MKTYLNKAGEEVKIGDVLVDVDVQELPYGNLVITTELAITKDNIDLLLKDGILVEKNPISDLKDVVDYLSSMMHTTAETTRGYIQSLYDVYPALAFSLLLRVISIMLDTNYPDHIKNIEEGYSVSLIDGKIYKFYRKQIRSFKNFAAFRTVEDAKIACRLLSPLLKEMFNGK